MTLSMVDQEFEISAVTKILNATLPIQFEFIDGVKDIVLFYNKLHGSLKFKIILNKQWVEQNFISDAMEWINDGIETDGHSHLSPFAANTYSNGLIDTEKIEFISSNVIKFLGLKSSIFNIVISYIVE